MSYTTTHNIHGNVMVIHGCGVAIVGRPGIGKSQLCLELLDRGHQIISDDSVLIERSSEGLTAYASPILLGLMHVRSVGAIEVAKHFSPEQVVKNHRLHLLVRLEENPSIHKKSTELFGHEIAYAALSNCSNRPLPILLETLVRKWQLDQNNEKAELQLKTRQNLALENELCQNEHSN